MKIELNENELHSFLTGIGEMSQAISEGVLIAFESISRDVARVAAANAPYKRGHLRSSIVWDTWQAGNGIVEATVGSNLVYARIQEFGGYTGRGYRSFIRPKLYLTGAVEAMEPQIPGRIEKWIAYQQAKRGL